MACWEKFLRNGRSAKLRRPEFLKRDDLIFAYPIIVSAIVDLMAYRFVSLSYLIPVDSDFCRCPHTCQFSAIWNCLC